MSDKSKSPSKSPNMDNQQALEALKKHGGNIVAVAAVVVASYFGWQYYQDNYAKVDTKAADTYTQIDSSNDALKLAAQNPDLDDAAKSEVAKSKTAMYQEIDALVAAHGKTAYAWQALMIKARHQSDDGQYKDAISTLEAAQKIDHGDDGLHALTKLQLARVLLSDGDTKRASEVVSGELPAAFEASKQELLGDIHVVNKDNDAAKTAYTAAWALLKERQEHRSILALKLQSLGVEVESITKPQAVSITPPEASHTADAQAQSEQSGDTGQTGK